MVKRQFFMGITCLAFFILGCSTADRQQDMLNKNWGRSYETAKHMQIIDPDAGKNQIPVTGLNGEAAVVNLEKYIKGDSTTKKSTAQDFRINLSREK